MKKLMSFLILAIGIFGCSFGCQTEEVISSGLGSGLAKSLNCANQPQIQADVTSILNLTKICGVAGHCQEKKMGTIANVVCPLVGATATAYLGSKIPNNWQCQPSTAESTVSGAIVASCELLPF